MITEELLFINKRRFHGQEKWGRHDLITLIFRFFTRLSILRSPQTGSPFRSDRLMRPSSAAVLLRRMDGASARTPPWAHFLLLPPHMPRASENIIMSLEFEKLMQIKRVYNAIKIVTRGKIYETGR
jgi:hypothetical protein